MDASLAEKLVGEHKIYRPTHLHHPCVRWCAEARENFRFALTLGKALAAEFALRFGHAHASGAILDFLAEIDLETLPFPGTSKTAFVQALPARFRGPDAVRAYRRYYLAEKLRFARWAHGVSEPAWVRARSSSPSEFEDGSEN